MANWIAALAIWLALTTAAPAATPVGTASIEARMMPDGVHAVVSLDRPVTAFAFEQRDVVREGDFDLLTPGITLKGDRVTSAKPFRRFALRIRPTSQERDAKYPAHYRVGAGGVVFAPALLADASAWKTRLTFRTAPGQIRLPATGAIDEGFVFIGPAVLRRQLPGVTVVADPATPAWLIERTGTDMVAAVDSFTKALRVPLPRKPLLILKHVPGDSTGNVGDVTPGAITTMRFHGPAWMQPNANAGKALQGFVMHEAFHFWNGGLVRHSQNAPTWLHEGGAEYAALMGGLASGLLTDGDVRTRLSQSLTRCREAVQRSGDKGLADMGFLTNQVRYPCGTVLQWAADLHVRRTGGGRTVMDAWADMIAVARRTNKPYELVDFYKAAGIADGAAFTPAALLVDRAGPDRWAALAAALNALGADVSQVATVDNRRPPLFFHLLGQNCRNLPEGTGYGFYADNGAIKLDSPAGCGVLAGNPALKAIEGGDPFAMTDATYKAVQARCAAGATVTLTTADGRTLAAPCAKPLADAPPAYVVDRWRPAS